MMHNCFGSDNWFSTTIQYEGWGKAEFDNPQGVVEGPVEITFNEVGEPIIKMIVDSFSPDHNSPFDLAQLLGIGTLTKVGNNISLAIGGGKPKNVCSSLIVKTKTGTFSALDHSISYLSSPFGESPITFHPARSSYVSDRCSSPFYWVLPLINFISDFHQGHSNLDHHPLRIFPITGIKDSLPNNDIREKIWKFGQGNRLIVFTTKDEHLGFIEPLPDYRARRDKLVDGRESALITALMIGRMDFPINNNSDLRGWPPFEFLYLLGLATGTEIGIPWVELRDEEGELVQRIHYRVGHEKYIEGHRAIHEGIHDGIGRLLTQAQNSKDLGKSFLRVTIRHLVRSGYDGLTLEDKLAYLIRGLDGLCNEYGLTKALTLSEILEDESVSAVQTIINEAAKSIHSIANDPVLVKGEAEKVIINRIAEKLSQSVEISRGFGKNLKELLKLFELPDSDIMSKWYQLNPREDKRKWEGVLSYYRGTIFHKGFLNLDENGEDLWDVVRIIDHLHDILVRLLFRILLYDGTYQPKVIHVTTEKAVDWVKEETTATDLGF